MAAAATPVRGRRRRKAPPDATPVALKYLEAYLDDKSNRKVATAALLRCSTRTAGRLTSRVTPYDGRMKMEWLSRICVAVGKPIEAVLGIRDGKSYQVALVGWNHSEAGTRALQDAMDCGLAILNRALVAYSLSGGVSVRHYDGRPHSVTVMLSPNPDLAVHGKAYAPHQLIVTEEPYEDDSRMNIKHVCPIRGLIGDELLTVQSLETQLQEIHARTKNITTRLQRESL